MKRIREGLFVAIVMLFVGGCTTAKQWDRVLKPSSPSSSEESQPEPPPDYPDQPPQTPTPPRLPPPSPVKPSPPPVRPAPPPTIKKPQSVEIQRHPTVEVLPRVSPGKEFAVQVSLTEKLVTPEVDPNKKKFTLPSQNKWRIEVVVTGRGFDFRDGINTGSIELPREGDSTVALFHLSAQQVGELTRPVYVSFYYENRFLFRVSRSILVFTGNLIAEEERRDHAPDNDPRRMASIRLGDKPPDLSIEIVSGRILIHGRGMRSINAAYTPPQGLAEFLRGKYAQLAAMAGRGLLVADPQASQDTAKGIGRELYRRFVPAAFKEAFWFQFDRLRESFTTIQIYSDDPLLPWELIIPSRRAGSEERDYLGLEFQVSRWHARQDHAFVASPPQQLDLEEVVLVAPRYDPPLRAVEHEIKAVMSFPQAKVRRVPAREAEMRPAFSALPRGILHFAGHGVVVQDDVRGNTYSILLEDDRELTLDRWRGMLSLNQAYHPFIFFNACDIGRAREVVNFVDGWAPAMLDAGASAFLGALWPVADAKAAQFAQRFYEALAERLTTKGTALVVDAVSEARRLYRDSGDPTFLAYVYYGDPYLTVHARR